MGFLFLCGKFTKRYPDSDRGWDSKLTCAGFLPMTMGFLMEKVHFINGILPSAEAIGFLNRKMT